MGALRGLGRVLVDAVRVFVAHWPQLVTLYLLGAAGRLAFLWIAVEVSAVNATLARIILPLAPLATLISFVLMLRVTAETLPAFSDMFNALDRRERLKGDLTATVQVLVPFLAVYSSQGLLEEDVRLFSYDATIDDYLTSLDLITDRLNYDDGPVIAALVVGALVARKLITLFDLAQKSVLMRAFATYLEALWMVTLARVLTMRLDELAEWVKSREAVAWAMDAWDGVLAAWGGFGAWLLEAYGWITEAAAQLGGLVLVPVAWLAIGAAVYGAELKSGPELLPREEINRRLNSVPQPVRRAVGHVIEPVTSPVQDALSSLGKVASAGLAPMVLFCLVFVGANQLQVGAALLSRTMLGVRDSLEYTILSPYTTLVERSLYFIATVVLVSAAVNYVVRQQTPAEDAAQARRVLA